VRGGQALASIAAATVISAAGLVAVALLGRPTPREVAADPEPVYVTVRESASDRNQPAVVTATLTASPVVRSAGAGGLVTAVSVRPGDELGDGSAVYSADGVPVHAYVSPTPLFRSLSLGDHGEDVVALQEFLAKHTEREVPPDGRFGPETAAAVRDWQRGMGLRPTGVAEASWFVRLDAPGIVDTVALTAGVVAPGLGEAVLSLRPEVASLEVTAERETVPAEYLLIMPSGRALLTFDGSAWSAVDPASLASTLAGGGPDGAPGMASAPATGHGTGGVVRIEARLALAEPIPAVIVPPAALVASISGPGVCVWQRAAGVPTRVDHIHVLATTASGAALIDDPSLDGTEVLLDPPGTLLDATCP